MKVLVINGSPRLKGNSDLLCNEFIRGAEECCQLNIPFIQPVNSTPPISKSTTQLSAVFHSRPVPIYPYNEKIREPEPVL